MKSKTRLLKLLGLVLAQALVVSACVNPSKLPGVSAIAEREDERAKKETDEAIKNSPALQELDAFCSAQVPATLGFVSLHRRLDSSAGRLTLSYSYHSDANFDRVKQEYKNQLVPNGWRVTLEEEVSSAESRIEFAGNDHTIKVYYIPSGKETNYKVYCEKVQGKQ